MTRLDLLALRNHITSNSICDSVEMTLYQMISNSIPVKADKKVATSLKYCSCVLGLPRRALDSIHVAIR